MKFLLADTLVYNDEDGSFALVDTPEEAPQMLTGIANAIMKLLVNQHGNVVEREAFLRQVWDERGLQGSNNSLNQYISILRKILAGLVPDALFIVTVPKVGFMLSAELPVLPLRNASGEREPTGRQGGFRFELLFCCLLTLVVVAISLWSLVMKAEEDRTEMHLLTHIGTCPVYTFSPLADVFHDKAISLTQTIQRDGHFACQQNAIFYLHVQNGLLYGHEGRLVLSQCFLNQDKASACRTLYTYEW